ncbi:helix-turn-helix domain-containing protein [Runella sp.]|uniref:helix-turn-helix domain-containing protein n=1 Tax=Runella sp. TaxID=1960881 RepID=UPI003D13831E
MSRHSRALTLTDTEKAELLSITKKGTHKSRKIIRAKALLLLDSGKSRLEIQSELGIDSNNYYKIKKRYFAGGLSSALEELPRSGQPPKITERLEAQITSIACSDAPTGSAKWTLSLINEKLVTLHYIETISNESIRQVLKKAGLSLG